jgi:type IV pilus assembly protein PilZ
MAKRAAARYPTSLRALSEGPSHQIVTNLSSGGMFLRTDRPLPVGTLLSVALELPDGDGPAPILGRVVHVVAPAPTRPSSSGPGVGIQFVGDATGRIRVDRYLESIIGAAGSSRRPQYPRLNAPVYWRPSGLPLFWRKRNPVEDDLGGVSVYLDEELKESSRLKIEIFLPDGTSVVCKVVVAWVDRLPEGAPARFDAGLGFTALEPSDRERLSQVLERAS